MKQAWAAEPTFSTMTLLMGSPAGDADIYCKTGIFCFADMLPVKLSISLL